MTWETRLPVAGVSPAASTHSEGIVDNYNRDAKFGNLNAAVHTSQWSCLAGSVYMVEPSMKISRSRALALLSLCRGDEIWSLETCREHRLPDAWIDELSDTFESGFASDQQTIYVDERVTNQYHGVRDLDIAKRLAPSLGLDFERVTANVLSKRGMVLAIKQAVFEGD